MNIEWAVILFRMLSLPLSVYLVGSAFLNKKNGNLRRFHLPYLLVVTVVSHFTSVGYESLLTDYPGLLIAARLLRICLTYWAVLYLFEGRFTSKLFPAGLSFALVAISDFASGFLYGAVRGTLDAASAEDVQNIGSAIVVLLAFIVWLLRGRIVFTRGNTKLYLLQTGAYVLNSLLMAAVLTAALSTGEFSVLHILLELGLLAGSMLLFVCFETMEAVYQQNQEYALQEQQHKLREEYYQEVEAHQKEVRTLKHDMKNMLLSLGAYIRKGDSQVAGREIESLLGQLTEGDTVSFTAHPGLNALLGAKYRQAQSDGILCEFDVRVPSDLAIAENDLASVVGNVLDNAIEASLHCADRRYIRLILVSHANTLALSCENSTDGAQSLETRKQDKKSHGIGLGSIRETVAKYKGFIQHRFDAYSFLIELTMFTA